MNPQHQGGADLGAGRISLKLSVKTDAGVAESVLGIDGGFYLLLSFVVGRGEVVLEASGADIAFTKPVEGAVAEDLGFYRLEDPFGLGVHHLKSNGAHWDTEEVENVLALALFLHAGLGVFNPGNGSSIVADSHQ